MPAPEGGANAVTRRLFFALWPDEDCRARLTREARRLHAVLGGRVTEPASIHLTLLFLGELPDSAVDTLVSLAARVDLQPFTLRMAAVGCWPHNRVAWMAPARTPAALATLVEGLRAGAPAAGAVVETRAFTPHVTLIRKAHCRAVDGPTEPFDWPVRDFALVRSALHAGGARYEILRRWSARPAAD